MKKLILISFIALLSLSCKSKVEATAIPKINGYWEIEKVILPDGQEKKYTYNDIYDYFEIKDTNGIRKKVMPQLDGTFLVNDTFEIIKIKETDGKYYIYCSTSLVKWKEEIISLNDTELVLLNASNKEYHYKRATPINLTGNGKKTQ